MEYNTLFATPSFLNGIARVLDLGSTLNQYDFFESGQEMDSESLRLDWETVGQDLCEAMDEYTDNNGR